MEVTDSQGAASDSQGVAKKQNRKQPRSKSSRKQSGKPAADTTQSESASGNTEVQPTSKGYEYSLPECRLQKQNIQFAHIP